MEPSKRPAVRFGFLAQIGAVGAYLLLVFLQAAGESRGGLVLIAGSGFALGVLIGRWWAPAIGAVAAVMWAGLAPGEGNTWIFSWYLLALLVPGAIAFGVLATRLRRGDRGTAGRVVAVGAGMLAVAVLGFAVFGANYNDDASYPAIANWGLATAVLLGPLGLGLLLAGAVGALIPPTGTRGSGMGRPGFEPGTDGL